MCGLVGLINATATQRNQFGAMISTIAHRGPDASGAWHDESSGLSLGHVRLSIIDVSDAGAQPMLSRCGRYVLSYNGEIYNHLDIRNEIERRFGIANWRGESDTETLLCLVEHVGVSETLQLISGMFAFALWDKKLKCMTLARDRIGEKPMYYGKLRGAAIFASELKSISANQEFTLDIDEQSVQQYGQFGFVPSPRSIYKSIRKLPAGCFSTYSTESKEWSVEKYWEASSAAVENHQNPLLGSDDQLLSQLESTLLKVVGQEMMSDVPLGAFLSGGIDSSLIVSIMQSLSSRQVSTYTIGFSDESFNEAKHAKSVAKHLGTSHTELYIDESDLLDLVPRMGSMYDEPFSDESALPTYMVSQLARKSVSVALSGDGGDEFFCGYNRHRFTASTWKSLERLPLGLRFATAKMVEAAASPLSVLTSQKKYRFGLPSMTGDSRAKMQKLSHALTARNVNDLYGKLLTGSVDVDLWPTGIEGNFEFSNWSKTQFDQFSDVELMQLNDQLFYLPDNILVKTDRASMNCSLETRAPFLHPDIVSLSWRLPHHLKFRNGCSKWALKEILYRRVPKDLLDRPKAGFEVPISKWMRGPLRDWVFSLTSPDAISKHGIFSSSAVESLIDDYYNKGRDRTRELWRLVCFQAWYQDQIVEKRP